MSTTTTDPRQVAAELLAEHDTEWVARLADELDRRLGGRTLRDLMRAWHLSVTDLGALFGVTRQAAAKWLDQGIPPERAPQVGDVQAIAELLDRYLKRDRVPAVVRRTAPGLGGESLLTMIAAGGSAEALTLTRRMFAFGDVHQ